MNYKLRGHFTSCWTTSHADCNGPSTEPELRDSSSYAFSGSVRTSNACSLTNGSHNSLPHTDSKLSVKIMNIYVNFALGIIGSILAVE